jgi:hypothetical protein
MIYEFGLFRKEDTVEECEKDGHCPSDCYSIFVRCDHKPTDKEADLAWRATEDYEGLPEAGFTEACVMDPRSEKELLEDGAEIYDLTDLLKKREA